MLKGGTKIFEVVFTQELEVLAKGMGGRKKFYPVLRGGTTSFCHKNDLRMSQIAGNRGEI